MGQSEIKIIEKGLKRTVFIDGIEQKSVSEVSVYVIPGEVTEVNVKFVTGKFEVIREE